MADVMIELTAVVLKRYRSPYNTENESANKVVLTGKPRCSEIFSKKLE